jgi:hypothetical protein
MPSGEPAEEGLAGEGRRCGTPGTGTQRALDAICGGRREVHRAADQGETYAVGDPTDGVKKRLRR